MAKINPSTIELGTLLGKGGYGAVYRMKDSNGKVFAIKRVNADRFGLKELGELNNLKRFDHPNIIKCVGFTVDPMRLGIILPLASGDMTMTTGACKHLMTNVVLTEWFYQLISAVHFMHKNGFYHCDIKPQNILLIGDKVVLSDLGLVGKKGLDTDNVCQTYMSPQLLLRRLGPLPPSIINHALFRMPSTEYQDDIWALGQTFYLMIPNVNNYLTHKFPKYDTFITDRVNVLKQSKIPDTYIPLLLKLLDPLPSNRDLNLISLLHLDLFKDRKKLVDGNMTVVNNHRPVIFGTDKLKAEFNNVLHKLLERFPLINNDLPIQACDLLYRTYEYAKPTLKTPVSVDNYIKTVLMLVLKINNRDNSLVPNSEMKMFEMKMIDWTNGNLSRTVISDFIDPLKYPVFIEWLKTNVEHYEQLGLDVMTQTINAL